MKVRTVLPQGFRSAGMVSEVLSSTCLGTYCFTLAACCSCEGLSVRDNDDAIDDT